MKSQFPSGISGLRGQGPNTLSRACHPTLLDDTASATGGWHRANHAHPPVHSTIHAFQMTKDLKTAFLYNIHVLNRLRFKLSEIRAV